MTEATCRRELELEIPADKVEKEIERTAREFARVARVPGFRPGKAPVTLIRRRFNAEIQDEVVHSLVPEYIEQAVNEKKLVPITRPQVDHVDYAAGGPMRFRAVFEILPDFELQNYKEIEVEVPSIEVCDEDVEKTLEEVRERSATFAPVDIRAIANGDYAQLKLVGVPTGGGEPLKADNVLCHVGGEETVEAFTENLLGAKTGETRQFEVNYPGDFPDPKLAGKSIAYTAEVLGIKEKKLPSLDDAFAKDVSKAETLEEFRAMIRKDMATARDQRRKELATNAIIEKLVAAHDFPVPEALVEHQMDVRLERAVRSLAAQGVDPRAVNVDWVSLRRKQRDRAVTDVKAELLLDRIATAEDIDTTEEELDEELGRLAQSSGESATALRARLTKDGVLDRMKSKLRADKALDWLYRNARIQTTATDSK